MRLFGRWLAGKTSSSLTTLARFIGLVPAVFLLVAHFVHADTLPVATLELLGAFTSICCGEEQGSVNTTVIWPRGNSSAKTLGLTGPKILASVYI